MGGGQELEEVQVIGNLAIDRKTPVAVTRISTKQIAEELGSQDLPMILNSTPGCMRHNKEEEMVMRELPFVV